MPGLVSKRLEALPSPTQEGIFFLLLRLNTLLSVIHFFIFEWIMAARVKIDFENVYELEEVSSDLKLAGFYTHLENGDDVLLNIRVSNDEHELMPNVYNLSFGPLDRKGNINDRAELAHLDYSKVFSTILLSAFTYLEQNTNHYLGVDGLDNNSAYFYYRSMMRNIDYLDKQFDIYGIKYFVRISRLGKAQYDNPFDFEDIMIELYKIAPGHHISHDSMYNYFIFGLKHVAKNDLDF